MEEKTLIQCEDDCTSFLSDAESALRAIGERECPYSGELEDFVDYFGNPYHYILRGRERYLEDWLDLQDAVVAWLVEHN